MQAPSAGVAGRPEFEVRRRFRRIQLGLARPFAGSYRTMLAGLGAGATIALAATYGLHSPIAGAAIGLAIGGAVFAVAILPLDADLRWSLELINDHNSRERADWQARTGTKMPVGIRPQERWLAAHPDSWGRATILLGLGRLDEAEAAIRTPEPAAPEERFDVELFRATRDLLAGHRPDLPATRTSWEAIPEPEPRRQRRECLAIFEAMVAAADHADPIAPLARARGEIGPVPPAMRIGRLYGRWLAIGGALIVVAALVGSALS